MISHAYILKKKKIEHKLRLQAVNLSHYLTESPGKCVNQLCFDQFHNTKNCDNSMQ